MSQHIASEKSAHRWWKEASIYQIYPASFKDSNDDGWGDLPGITSKLDTIAALGVDVVWLSPIYPSPQVDMGYDISDYKNIDPKYGTLADLDELVAQMKRRGVKLMMDLVVNHTSDQHAWFKESRSSLDNPKRDWYIWKPPKGRDAEGNLSPPNNWEQLLGEGNSAWTYDEATDQFYLSLFTPEQPDLNWENEAVRAAVHDVMLFWLERGASGFRMDVINHISKVQTFPDAPIVRPPPAKYQPGNKFFANGPRLHEFLREIYDKVLSQYDAITVGEMPFVEDIDEIIRVVGADAHELQMIFIFDIVGIDGGIHGDMRKWGPHDLAAIVIKWQRAMLDRNGWNSLFVENHDQPRSASRFVDESDAWRAKGAKLLALMQTTLSGTPYVYQGQEIGMRNMPASWPPAEYKDIYSQNILKQVRDQYPEDKEKYEHARWLLSRKARDHARTPIQWDASPNAGFTSADITPWMRVNDDYRQVNFAAQVPSQDEGSKEGNEEADGGMTVWQFWQRGLKCRKEHKDVFVYGDFTVLEDGRAPSNVFAYLRTAEEKGGDEDSNDDSASDGKKPRRWLIALNFTGQPVEFTVPEQHAVRTWVAGNYVPGKIDDKPASGRVQLQPWEGILGICDS